jgi:hypothetical protein
VEYTVANFAQTALQYTGEAVEVKATSMFIGAGSCKGLMEYRSSAVIKCPYGLPLGAFQMPLDGTTRFVRNLDWAVVDREVVLFGGMINGQNDAMKVGSCLLCWLQTARPAVGHLQVEVLACRHAWNRGAGIHASCARQLPLP